MRIGLAGTMSVGKTTLARALGELDQFKDHSIQTERSKYLSNLGIPLNTEKKVAGMVVKNVRTPDNKSYRYFVQVHQKGKKDEKVLELIPDSVEFVDMGDRGHRQVVSQYKFNNLPADVYNSKTVYNNPGLGIEAVGG